MSSNTYIIQVADGAKKPSRKERSLLSRLHSLIEDAEVFGYVITVEQVASKPLAMGNYTTKAYIRPARDTQGGL
jgi:hypothetical protein